MSRGLHRRPDYSRGKLRNPFRLQQDRSGSKMRILLIFAGVCALVSIGMLMYHSMFQIRTITVYGTIRLNNQEVQDVVHSLLSGTKWSLPGSNFFLVHESSVEEFLLERYPLESVEVTKVFPSEVKIDIQEKITKVLYTDGEQVQFIDQDGLSIETLRKVFESEWVTSLDSETIEEEGVSTTTTRVIRKFQPDIAALKSEYGDYPIVFSVDAEPLAAEEIQDALSWFRLLHSIGEVEYQYQKVHEGISYGSLVISGVNVYVSSRLSQEIQQNLLLSFLAQQESGIQHFQYIDLRYAPAVYWK